MPPSVSGPSDGGYQYYQKNITDLQDEMKAENERAKKRADDRIAHAEEANARALRDKDEQTEATINEIRKNSNDTITHERDLAQADVRRVKDQTYDRFGRSHGLEADVLKRQLDDTTHAMQSQHDEDQRAYDDLRKSYETKLADQNVEQAAKLEEQAKAAHDSAQESYEAEFNNRKQQYDAFKSEAEKKYAAHDRDRLDDQNFQRRRYELAYDTAQRDFDHRTSRLKEANQVKTEEQQRHYEDQATDEIRRINDSHADETRTLRDQVKELIADSGQYMKEKGQGTQDAVNEYEDGWRLRETLQREGYEREIAKMKNQAHETESYLAHQNNQNLREKDLYFAGLIGKQNQENHLAQKNIENTYRADRDQLDLRSKRDREQARATLESQLHDASAAKDQALEAQAKAYQDTINRNRLNDQEQIKGLEKTLQYKSTSDDTSAISPAAEAAVRKSLTREYEKTLAQERERNFKATDSIQHEYGHRLNESTLNNEARETLLKQQHVAERHADQANFLDHLQDAEFLKETALRNRDYEANKQTENLNRSYAQMMERARRESEEILEATKNDAAAKITAVRQEAEFNSRMAQRTFSARQNELIRDYDKKLADQKVEYEAKIDDLKGQTNQTVREADRRNRLALEEQARAYEQRLAQSEAQHKERERYLTQNFQEEIEKVKRSNALLIQKKS